MTYCSTSQLLTKTLFFVDYAMSSALNIHVPYMCHCVSAVIYISNSLCNIGHNVYVMEMIGETQGNLQQFYCDMFREIANPLYIFLLLD